MSSSLVMIPLKSRQMRICGLVANKKRPPLWPLLFILLFLMWDKKALDFHVSENPCIPVTPIISR